MTCFSGCFRSEVASSPRITVEVDEEVSRIRNVKLYTYGELSVATEGFNKANLIGEGGYGAVYKGRLRDGVMVAVKVLSAESRQGTKEFLTEINVISDIEHENLLMPPDMTHISTQIAGTLGYLAPEYAIHGRLTRKADIYSFGVLLLEIVSGTCNRNKQLPIGEESLLERAWAMYEAGELHRVVDFKLEQNVDLEEACKFLKIGFLSTQGLPKLRPLMSQVVKMLTGEEEVDDKKILKPGMSSQLMGRRNQKEASDTSSGEPKRLDDLSSDNTNSSCATMTFTSIHYLSR
ncbi:Non-specific serine/threonine protein kinase [Bertholletia excelsa]